MDGLDITERPTELQRLALVEWLEANGRTSQGAGNAVLTSDVDLPDDRTITGLDTDRTIVRDVDGEAIVFALLNVGPRAWRISRCTVELGRIPTEFPELLDEWRVTV